MHMFANCVLMNAIFNDQISCFCFPNYISLVVCRYEVLSISIYYRFPLCPFCAANIFGQGERRRDQSHVWSQDILESLASESSFHHHLSHTASVNIVIDIHCPRSGQMCWMACRRLEFCIRTSCRSGRIETLIWPLSFVPEILLEPAAARHQHRNCTCYIMMHHPSLPMSGSCNGFAISASRIASKESSFERNSSEGRLHLWSCSFKNGYTLLAWGGRKWAKACKASSLTSSRTAILPTRTCWTIFNSSKQMSWLNLPSLEGDLTSCNIMQACKRSALSPLLRCSNMSLANKCLNDFEADLNASLAQSVVRTRA